MKVADLFAGELASGSVNLSGDGDTEVTDMVIDSRTVAPGALFAALAGPRHDGHSYVQRALDAGATALLVARGRGPAGSSAAVVEADNVRDVIGPAANRLFGRPSERMELFGVTGTNGKTSVTSILEGILTCAGREAGVIGTIEYRWRGRRRGAPCTTPEAVDLQRILRAMADDGVTAAAMEVSSHSLAQKRTRGCRFSAAIFTNLSRDHLDYHDGMEEYFEAKSLLFSADSVPVRVANGDDPWGRRLAESVPGTLTFGTTEGCDYRATGIEAGPEGLRFTIAGGREAVAVQSRLVGMHNVSNILAAAAASLAAGLPARAVREGVAAVDVIPGRFETVPSAGGPLVLVDYAHTPDALEYALAGAREMTTGRLIVVFGCGGDRDRGKRPLMGRAAASRADVTWLTSDNPRSEDPRSIIGQIRQGFDGGEGSGKELYVEEDRRTAIAAAIEAAEPEDLVLIAGKGHEDYQETAAGRRAFSDRQEARAALESREK